MFTELHELSGHPSYDRESIESQDESASGIGGFNYTSYSRYRFNMDYDAGWGRFTAERDAVHWGPGLFSNLSFHQNAVPFNHITFSTVIGPLYIISLYAPLAISTNSKAFITSSESRSLYAHRYEWTIARNLLLGISEQLVMYEDEDPFAFIPVVPLFIAKSTKLESSNNGNIALDVAYRFPGLGRLYSEFLIDDLQSPGSLFDDFWGNKWAWMAGVHFIKDFESHKTGMILECSRVEPWVYTHYDSNTAQAAHMGFPLGNQLGPNSQSLTAKVYWRKNLRFYLSGMFELIWKGTDLGSQVNDAITAEARNRPKVFIQGIGSPDVYFAPYGYYRWKRLIFEGKLRFGEEFFSLFRVQFQY
jgi:hypothetical protein